MNDVARDGVDVVIFSALPLALCLYGFDGRLLIATESYCTIWGLPTEALRPGTSFFETMRVLAYRGAFGPGDPEQQARALTEADRGQVRRLRRRYPDGRILEIDFSPVPDGRLLVSVTDQTALVARRDQAEATSRWMGDMIDGLKLGVAVLDPSLNLMFRNRRFAEMLARPAEQLPVGMTFEQLLHLVQDGPIGAIQQAVQSPHRTPSRTVLESGDLVELATSRLPQGEWLLTINALGNLVPVAADDTRRDRLNAAIIEILPHGVCVYGPDRRVRMVNEAYARLLPDEAVAPGDPFNADGPFDPTRSQLLRRRLPGGTALDMWIIPLPDAGFMCITVDATGATHTEDAAGQRFAQITRMIASLPHGVLLWDADRRLVAANPRAADLLELPPERLAPGRSHGEFLTDLAAQGAFGTPEETGPRLRELLERDRTRHHLHRRANRAGRIVEVDSTPLPPDPHAGSGFVVTYTDVTEHRAAEGSLRRARETAEAAHTAKSRFLATMSHELRTPLNAVIGYSEALAREANEPVEPERIALFTQRAVEFANIINKAGHDLLDLVNNMIDVARIESGRFDLSADRIELPHLVAACIRQINTAARAAEVAIETDIPAGLPVLLADERRLRQILVHLVTNAINFTSPGGTVRVAAALAGEGELQHLLLSVSDTGIGMAEADLDRAFEPFFQADSALSRRAAGSGLGLYFCRALVTAHGGTLTLSSREGQGTTAMMRLPRTRLSQT